MKHMYVLTLRQGDVIEEENKPNAECNGEKKIKSRGTSERKKEKLIPGCKLEEKKKEKSLQYSFSDLSQ